MRQLITSALRGATVARLHDQDAVLLKAGTTTPTSSLDNPVESWDDPSTLAAFRAGVQPASAAAQEAFGVTFKSDRVIIYTDPTSEVIAPVTNRLIVSGVAYAVVQVRRWPSHVEVLAERVEDGGVS